MTLHLDCQVKKCGRRIEFGRPTGLARDVVIKALFKID